MSHLISKRSLGILSLISTLTCLAACEDESFSSSASAIIELSPRAFLFPASEPGSSAVEKNVLVKNSGEGTLLLTRVVGNFPNTNSYELDYKIVNLTDGQANDEDLSQDFFYGIDPVRGNTIGTVEVEPNQALVLKLRYFPDAEGAGGSISMRTNASGQEELIIPIEGVAAQGDVVADTLRLDFGRVNANDRVEMEVTLSNVGTSVARITNVFLSSGGNDFSVSLRGEDVIGSVADIPTLQDPDNDGQPGLSPMTEATFVVTYAPPVQGPDAGELEFALAGALQERIIVNLTANGASPCLNLRFETNPNDNSTLQFGPALIGVTTPGRVFVESCGGQGLEVTNIRYEGAPEFALGPDAMPFILPAASETRPERFFTMNFSPTEAEVYEGFLIISSNDTLNPELRVPVIGRGTVNACPIAQVVNDRIDALPLEIITLDASPSSDIDGPGGRPVSYEWIVVSRPEGSTAQPVERFFNPLRPADGGEQDDLRTPTAQFFVDLAGEYVFNLVVTDELGFSAPSNTCAQQDASVVVNSLPDEDIHVELTWTTPGDPNETDTEGTDVDLHFMHPNGTRWNGSPYDCYFNNPSPDWGPSGPIGNPSLDIDDVNGAGPENINLNDPEFTDQTTIPGPYRVGVHYYRSGGLFTDDYGPSDATIRIYLGGSLAGTYTQTLNTTDNFWEVAGIIWTASEQRVQEINRFYPTTPW